MQLLIIITSITLLIYAGLMLQFRSWWREIPTFSPLPADPALLPFVSVLVPARNEQDRILPCLRSLLSQDYPAHLYEILVIDDHSTDLTAQRVQSLSDTRLRLLASPPELPGQPSRAPKKKALQAGIAAARGSWILCTDADCQAPPGWIRHMMAFAQSRQEVFVAAPVKIPAGESLLSRFQALDFLTMQGITGAVVNRNFMQMCNGANLAYQASAFAEVRGFEGVDHIASGDDMLLMNKMARAFPGRLGFLKSREALISTAPAASWREFFQQRIRWASKATHYRDSRILWVLLLVYFLNLGLCAVFVFSCWHPAGFLGLVLLLVVKFLAEWLFVRELTGFFSQQELMPSLLWLQPLHVLYIVVSGFFGQFRTYQWKDRKLS